MTSNYPKILILITCFFNYDFIERTIQSIKRSRGNFTYDIIFLENPSKYSPKIKQLAKKYNIHKHFVCDSNIEGHVNIIYLKNNTEWHTYDYIAFTEGDVILSPLAIKEAISIIQKNDFKLCSIDLYKNLPKYNLIKHKINNWVPKGVECDDYIIGHTGFQFILITKEFLSQFVQAVLNKELIGRIALGIEKFYGISDSNLKRYCDMQQLIWPRTKYNKLDHIGWEIEVIDNPHNKEYKNFKVNAVGKKIRLNINYDDYKLILLF